jgi:hypothetical protein
VRLDARDGLGAPRLRDDVDGRAHADLDGQRRARLVDRAQHARRDGGHEPEEQRVPLAVQRRLRVERRERFD